MDNQRTRALTLDNRAVASHVAGVSVNYLRYAWFCPKGPILWTAVLIVGVMLVVKLSLWFLILLLPILFFYVCYWIRVKNHFSHGDVNPGIVIDTNPTLVAVATDLAQRAREYPAIKVFRMRKRTFMGEPVQVGTRLPTVSLYAHNDDPKADFWSDFRPIPVECGTGDQAVLQRMMTAFTETEWLRLEASIERLPGKEPGLYSFKTWPAIQQVAVESMALEQFWQIIEASASATEEEQLERIKGELQQLSLSELIGFQRRFLELKRSLYDWDIWLMAWLLGRGLCSDDNFNDFCKWVISQGRSLYEATRNDPQHLVDVLNGNDLPTFEYFSYVIGDVYTERTHRNLADLDVPHPDEPSGGEWLRPQLKDRSNSKMLNLCVVFNELGDEEFSEIKRRFPKLWDFCIRTGRITLGGL